MLSWVVATEICNYYLVVTIEKCADCVQKGWFIDRRYEGGIKNNYMKYKYVCSCQRSFDFFYSQNYEILVL